MESKNVFGLRRSKSYNGPNNKYDQNVSEEAHKSCKYQTNEFNVKDLNCFPDDINDMAKRIVKGNIYIVLSFSVRNKMHWNFIRIELQLFNRSNTIILWNKHSIIIWQQLTNLQTARVEIIFCFCPNSIAVPQERFRSDLAHDSSYFSKTTWSLYTPFIFDRNNFFLTKYN